MPIAKGSKSQIVWKQESTYDVAPSGNWNQLPINNETLDENIETIQAEDIRADRENPALRGGNIATAGQITHDLTPVRMLTPFRHLFAASSIATTTVIPATLAAETAYSRGDYVTNAALGEGDRYVCIRGGTTAEGVLPADLNATNNGVVEIDGAVGTKLKFQRVGAESITLYKHIITPGVDFPSVGLSFEKQIKGGNANLFVLFSGCRIGGLDLSIPQSGNVKATWNVLAKRSAKLAATGAGTPTLLAEDPYVGHDAYIHLNDSVGAGGKTFRDFSCNITNGIQEDVYCIGERFRNDLPEGTRLASGRFSLYFLDATEYDYFKNETEVPVGVSLIHKGLYWFLEFAEVKLTGSGTPKISGQGVVMSDFNWTAYKQDSAFAMRLTAVNLTAGASIPV